MLLLAWRRFGLFIFSWDGGVVCIYGLVMYVINGQFRYKRVHWGVLSFFFFVNNLIVKWGTKQWPQLHSSRFSLRGQDLWLHFFSGLFAFHTVFLWSNLVWMLQLSSSVFFLLFIISSFISFCLISHFLIGCDERTM